MAQKGNGQPLYWFYVRKYNSEVFPSFFSPPPPEVNAPFIEKEYYLEVTDCRLIQPVSTIFSPTYKIPFLLHKKKIGTSRWEEVSVVAILDPACRDLNVVWLVKCCLATWKIQHRHRLLFVGCCQLFGLFTLNTVFEAPVG